MQCNVFPRENGLKDASLGEAKVVCVGVGCSVTNVGERIAEV